MTPHQVHGYPLPNWEVNTQQNYYLNMYRQVKDFMFSLPFRSFLKSNQKKNCNINWTVKMPLNHIFCIFGSKKLYQSLSIVGTVHLFSKEPLWFLNFKWLPVLLLNILSHTFCRVKVLHFKQNILVKKNSWNNFYKWDSLFKFQIKLTHYQNSTKGHKKYSTFHPVTTDCRSNVLQVISI